MAKDLFSRQTSSYSKYRPTYPTELFQHILQFVDEKGTAWDCGTGNGQAASVLADYFHIVKATDISEKQLAMAKPDPRIEYLLSPAEKTPFEDNSFNLITVAQAYHWFNFKEFAGEVRRVSKPGGVIAVWGYNLFSTSNEVINKLVNHFYSSVVGPYWDAERIYLEEYYDTIPFDFPLLSSETFSINTMWSKAEFAGFFNSWSAVQHFITANDYNPVEQVSEDLAEIVPDDELIPVSFPVFLKLGRVK